MINRRLLTCKKPEAKYLYKVLSTFATLNSRKRMPQISSKQAAIYAAAILLLTLLFSFVLKTYEVMVGGLLIAIFFTTFIKGRSSTFLVAFAGLVVMTFTVLFLNRSTSTIKILTENIFSVLLVVFAVALVFYLKQLQQHLDFERIHMTSLFENATEGIFVTNASGNIILVNPAAERMFNYTKEELEGQTVDKLLPMRKQAMHAGLRADFHKSPSNRTMGSGRDLYAMKKGGAEFPVEVSLSYYKEKNETYVIAFIVDITLRKETEKNIFKQKDELEKIGKEIRLLNTELEHKVEERTTVLKQALEQLEQSEKELQEALVKEKELSEMKSRFVSMASHEFKTPLSTVLSSASLASKYTQTEDQDKRNKHLDKIKTSVKHLNDILEDFLSLGRLDEGKVISSKQDFLLQDLLKETIEEMQVMVKQGQQIILTGAEGVALHADKRLLKNVLINLLSNAIKFSPTDSAVNITVSSEGNKCQVAVKDRGIGISDHDQQYLFGSFYRAGNAQNIQGTGLGLHIVQRYMEIMGGSVHLQSKLDEGTTVTIVIPKH